MDFEEKTIPDQLREIRARLETPLKENETVSEIEGAVKDMWRLGQVDAFDMDDPDKASYRFKRAEDLEAVLEVVSWYVKVLTAQARNL